jgi:hypothetical protein
MLADTASSKVRAEIALLDRTKTSRAKVNAKNVGLTVGVL